MEVGDVVSILCLIVIVSVTIWMVFRDRSVLAECDSKIAAIRDEVNEVNTAKYEEDQKQLRRLAAVEGALKGINTTYVSKDDMLKGVKTKEIIATNVRANEIQSSYVTSANMSATKAINGTSNLDNLMKMLQSAGEAATVKDANGKTAIDKAKSLVQAVKGPAPAPAPAPATQAKSAPAPAPAPATQSKSAPAPAPAAAAAGAAAKESYTDYFPEAANLESSLADFADFAALE